MIPLWVVVLLGIAVLAVALVAVVAAYELGRRAAGAVPRLTTLVPLEPVELEQQQTRELWQQIVDERPAPTVVLPVDERTRDVRHTDAPGLYRVVCAPGDPCLRHRAHLLDVDNWGNPCCGCTQCPNREDNAR